MHHRVTLLLGFLGLLQLEQCLLHLAIGCSNGLQEVNALSNLLVEALELPVPVGEGTCRKKWLLKMRFQSKLNDVKQDCKTGAIVDENRNTHQVRKY